MEFRFGIIGCGKISIRHAENMARFGKIVAVCDIIPERADELAEKYGAKAYYSLQELLENEKQLSTVSICTPNGLHAHQSILCLDAGLNVLCEKPLCIKAEDGLKMIAAAKSAKKKLFVVKQNRFNPPVVEVKKILNENKLGKIFGFQLNCFWNRSNEYYLDTWRGTKNLDGGTLFTQFSHFIDVMYWMLGDVEKVQAFGKNFAHPTIEFEDSGVVIFEMQNGVIGSLNYTVNSYKKNMEGSITIFGEKGTIKIGGQYLNVLEYQSISDYELKNFPKSRGENDYGFYKGSMSNHDKVYENLFKALKNDKHEIASAEEGLKTVEIIEKIYNAMR
jgi:predicted dehydrogenase